MMELGLAVETVVAEYHEATEIFPKHNSPHESFSILMEGVDDLWDEVKTHGKFNNVRRMREEAKQVAAMAIRFMTDIC